MCEKFQIIQTHILNIYFHGWWKDTECGFCKGNEDQSKRLNITFFQKNKSLLYITTIVNKIILENDYEHVFLLFL